MINSKTDQRTAQLFDSVAAGYANGYKNGSFFSYYFNRRLEIVLDSLRNYEQAKILDVGCGPGMMAEQSIERGFEFFGIDISEKMIGECIKNFGHVSSVHFSVGKVQNLEFPDSFFDVILCMGVLEYVDRDEMEGAVSEMLRVLKPGGRIIISLMNRNSFFAWHRRARNSISRLIRRSDQNESYDDQAESYDGLSRSFDAKSFCTLLNSKSLNNINVLFFGLNIYPYFWEGKIPDRLRIKLSKGLDSIIRGKFKWPYMAFVVKATKQDKDLINVL
jgi:ubiquinone/menaquinone biosynthesis C-methylase UbiE